MATDVISKADLSRIMGVTRARVSQLVKRGLPVREDGRLNREEAVRWVENNNFSWQGGWAVRGKGTDVTMADLEAWGISAEDWAELEEEAREANLRES